MYNMPLVCVWAASVVYRESRKAGGCPGGVGPHVGCISLVLLALIRQAVALDKGDILDGATVICPWKEINVFFYVYIIQELNRIKIPAISLLFMYALMFQQFHVFILKNVLGNTTSCAQNPQRVP